MDKDEEYFLSNVEREIELPDFELLSEQSKERLKGCRAFIMNEELLSERSSAGMLFKGEGVNYIGLSKYSGMQVMCHEVGHVVADIDNIKLDEKLETAILLDLDALKHSTLDNLDGLETSIIEYLAQAVGAFLLSPQLFAVTCYATYEMLLDNNIILPVETADAQDIDFSLDTILHKILPEDFIKSEFYPIDGLVRVFTALYLAAAESNGEPINVDSLMFLIRGMQDTSFLEDNLINNIL